MYKLRESLRIKNIEQQFGNSIETILYNWHWKENLKHSEVGKRVDMPRSTITRWFKQFGVPSQESHRITNNNLLNVGPRKGPQAKPKRKKQKLALINLNFFKKWTPEMAYILGYFTADGSMMVNPRGAHFIEFTSVDGEQIKMVKKMMRSSHIIGRYVLKNPKWKTRYRLQIGSKEIFNDLLKLGLTPRKSQIIKLPEVPERYFFHFVRGYFDGDGSVVFAKYFRRNKQKWVYVFHTRFTSGSKIFLNQLLKKLKLFAGVKGGSLINKKDDSFELSFSTNDSRKLFFYFYKDVRKNCFLIRKYNKFQEALKSLGA